MKKYYLFIFSMLLCSIEILGQCEDRYESPIFENIIVDTLQYSDVTGFKMDVYTAADDDFTGLKPLIILAHGGSFYAGSKANPTMVRLGNEFAKRGYVVASIQYTLTSSLNLVDSLIMVETVMQAIGDGKAAIRWFRKDAEENGNQFNIDAEQIFVGGNSAGAVLMNNLAYIDEEDDLPAYMDSIIVANGGLEGNAGNFGYSTEVNGVVNLAGAIYRKWVISNNTKPPIFSAHGDIDDVVPFDCNSIFWGNLGNLLMEMCGSSIIHEVANDIGLQSELVVLEGEGHTPWSFEDGKMSTIVERSSNFVYNLLNCNITSVEELFSVESLNAHPNPSNNQINIDFKGFGTLFEIQVVDMLGKLVYEDISESSFYSLFRGDFKSGIYFLTAKNEKYTLKTKFIFK